MPSNNRVLAEIYLNRALLWLLMAYAVLANSGSWWYIAANVIFAASSAVQSIRRFNGR